MITRIAVTIFAALMVLLAAGCGSDSSAEPVYSGLITPEIIEEHVQYVNLVDPETGVVERCKFLSIDTEERVDFGGTADARFALDCYIIENPNS